MRDYPYRFFVLMFVDVPSTADFFTETWSSLTNW